MPFPLAKIHGFIGSSLIGTEPFNPRSWSGISRFLFRECEDQGMLHGATGGEVSGIKRCLLLARTFHPNREIWRLRYYLSTSYRQALSEVFKPMVSALPEGVDVLQIGGLFNIPSILKRKRRCFSYHDGNMAMRLKNPYASSAVPARLAQAAMAYERELYHQLDRVFTMSEYLRRSFIEDFGMPEDRVMCAGAGVNLETLPPERPDKAYDNGQILFIGVEFARKGGLLLLDAFAKVRQQSPHAKLHVVGPKTPFPAGYPAEGVAWHGNLNKQDAAQAGLLEHLFESSSVFVLPSLYEPFGIAPAEAMMHSLPAVVSGAWALGETVVDGETGVHVVPGDVNSLTQCLKLLLKDPTLCKSLGQAARRIAMGRFTWEKVVTRMRIAITRPYHQDDERKATVSSAHSINSKPKV